MAVPAAVQAAAEAATQAVQTEGQPQVQPQVQPDAKPAKGAAVKATIEKAVKDAASDATAAVQGDVTPDAEGETDLQKAHKAKKEAAKGTKPNATDAKIAALEAKIAELEGKGADTGKKKAEPPAKFEMPKLEMPDWDKIGVDDDIVPPLKKAFQATVDTFTKALEQLVAKVERLEGREKDLDDVVEYATTMSKARAQKFNKAFEKAIPAAVEKIKETYGLDEDPVDVSGAFVRMFQGGLIEIDPNEDLPDVDLLFSAWEKDNSDLLVKHASKNGKKEEKKEEKKVPVIRGASSGGGAGPEVSGRKKIEAIIREGNPDLKD